MQFHHIQMISEDDLPTGQEWALVEHDEQITLFIKERALTPRNLEEAWAAYRLLTTPRHPRLVHPRRIAPSPLMSTA
jgi:hypothetical protein